MLYPVAVHQAVVAAFLILLAVAAVHDVSRFRIPNRICAAILLLYPVHVLTAAQPVGWIGDGAVAALVFAVGIPLFMFRIVGGGDIKLLAVTALWAGTSGALAFLTVTAFVGAAMALVLMSPARFGLAYVLDRAGETGLRDLVLGNTLPYGVAIAAGGYVAVAGSLGL